MAENYGKPFKGRFSLHKRGNGNIYLSSDFTKLLLASGWDEKVEVNCIQVTAAKDGKLRFIIECSEAQ